MDVDRVACFHDAVLGYSSMLFELKSESDFHNFKVVLRKLWKALDNDGNLPKKLVRGHFANTTPKNIFIMINFHHSHYCLWCEDYPKCLTARLTLC